MARMRSPSYPSIGILQAIDLAEKIHRSLRTNVVSREVIAETMGYSGLTGRSLTLIAALIQFGLLEKAGVGDVRITETAVQILHGLNDKQKADATLRAGRSPNLFRDIYERFPDGLPTDSAIRSYLIQQDFADVAIGPAIRAFRETHDNIENILSKMSEHSERGKSDDAERGDLEEDQPQAGAEVSNALKSDTGTNARLPLVPKFGDRIEQFDSDEGIITISWPANLSLQSTEDMQDWLELLMKRIKRRAQTLEDEKTSW